MILRSKIIALAMALALAACGNESANSSVSTNNSPASTVSAQTTIPPSDVNSVVEPDSNPAWQTLNIGTEANFPPLRYIDENQDITGFHVEIIKAAAKAAELNVKFVITSNIKKLNLLPNNPNYQVILGTFANNEENRKFANFSNPIVSSKFMIYLRQNSGKGEGTLEDLKDKKISIDDYYANNPALKDIVVKATGSENNLVVKSRYFLAWQAMARGEADAVFSDNLMFLHTEEMYKDRVNYGYKAVDLNAKNDATILFEKNQTELLNKFNKGLDEIKKNGQYDAIQKKWFGDVV